MTMFKTVFIFIMAINLIFGVTGSGFNLLIGGMMAFMYLLVGDDLDRL